MTPKEKAKELVNRFMFAGIYFTDGIDGAIKNAKQCSLVAVNEIIDIAYWEYMESMGEQEKKYWQEVKQEIINL